MAIKNPIGFSKRTFSVSSNVHIKKDVITALESRLGTLGDVLDEHIHWAIAEQQAKAN